MSLPSLYLMFYAVLMFSGAYFGKRAGSQVSMIMGIVSGALTFIFLYFNWTFALIVLTGVLTLVFCKRLIATKKFMPSGMLLATSILAIMASAAIH